MSKYTRHQINELISKTKIKRELSNSLSPSLGSLKSSSPPIEKSPTHKKMKKQLTQKYNQICAKYRQLLEEVKDKSHEYKLQERQLTRLRADKDRDQKEIQRLRSMLGMIRKKDYGAQVNMDNQSASGSWTTKFERSTQIQLQSDGLSPKRVRSPQVMKAIMSRVSQTAKEKKYNMTGYHERLNEEAQQNFKPKQSILSPSQTQKSNKFFHKPQTTLQNQQKYNKLSNSPYSKLRYARTTSRYHPDE